MRDARFHILVLSALSVSSMAIYLTMFHSVSRTTATAMSLPTDKSASQQLSQKKQQLQNVQQQIQSAEVNLQSSTQNYQQAYSVVQQDDQVLQVLNQRLQSMGIQPVTLPPTPKPVQGISVSSASVSMPPPVQTTSRGS